MAFHAPLHRFETRSLRDGASSLRLHRDDVEDQHRRRDAAAAAAAAEAFAALPAVEAPTTVDGFEVEELATVEVVARLRSAAQVRAGAAMDSPKVGILPAATAARCDRRVLCANQIFNPTSMCVYATVSTRALPPCFENSTRAIDSSKNQPNRLRFDRAREF